MWSVPSHARLRVGMGAHQERNSDTFHPERVASLVLDPRPCFVPVAGSPTSYRVADWYAAALAELSERDDEAVFVLETYRLTQATTSAQRVALRRMGRRSYHRALSRASVAEQGEVKELRAQLRRSFGQTRPVRDVRRLAASLDEAGFGATEILRLLCALGLEPKPDPYGDPDAPRKRVQARLDRQRRTSKG